MQEKKCNIQQPAWEKNDGLKVTVTEGKSNKYQQKVTVTDQKLTAASKQ